MNPSPRHVLPLLCALLVLGVVLAIALDISPSHSPSRTVHFDGATFPAGLRAHDFALPNQRGQSVSLSDYRGQVVVLAFLFSACRACVLVAQQVRGALEELEPTTSAHAASPGAIPGVRTILVSTDPQIDTPASVRRFLNETSLSSRVEYLTGSSARLRAVWHAYGIAPVSAGRADAEAGTTVLLIGRDGTERVGFGLEQITPEGLAHDIRLLRAE